MPLPLLFIERLMTWVQTAEPVALAVDFALLKNHVRLTTSDEDLLLEDYARAAIDLIERTTGRALIQRTFRLDLADFPCWEKPIELPIAPTLSVQSVQYYETDGTLSSWPSQNYHLDLTPVRATISPKSGISYPSVELDRPNAAQVSFTAGYGPDARFVPAGLRQLVMLFAGHMFTHRLPVTMVSVQSMPLTFEYALNAYKVVPY